MDDKTIKVGSRHIEAANLEDVIFPGPGITQGDLISVYRRLSNTMLPHLAGRPLTMERYPDGIEEEGFYQREAPDYFPDWIRRVSVRVKEDDGEQSVVVCEDEATLVYLVDQGVVTPHVWLSRADRLSHPDKLVFDLDPSDDDFETVRLAGEVLHGILSDLGLASFVMTTGSRGAHVVVPLIQEEDFDTSRAFAQDVAKLATAEEPDRLTVEMRKEDRGDRLYVDTLRNAHGQNSVAPYAVRAKPGAPVATPLEWDEFVDPSLHSQTYTVENIFRRLGQMSDPWADIVEHGQPLGDARERVEEAAGDA
jgi:bifunctional non-homologous end joining protein LigD